jgi:predicted 2-oxoglutarate/Fe(II)-dependent dioxygenase YbiX
MRMSRAKAIVDVPAFSEIAVGIYEAQLFSKSEASNVAAAAARERAWATATISNEDKCNVVAPDIRTAEVLRKSTAIDLLARLGDRLSVATSAVAKSLAPLEATLADVHVIRYQPGGFFQVHRDNMLSYRLGRVVTVLCYLNDSFVGGELDFPEVRLCYRPRAGFGIVFPATFMHCARAVMQGEKFVLTAWYVSIDRRSSNVDQRRERNY